MKQSDTLLLVGGLALAWYVYKNFSANSANSSGAETIAESEASANATAAQTLNSMYGG